MNNKYKSSVLKMLQWECELVLERAMGSDAKLLSFQLDSLSGNLGFMGEHNILQIRYKTSDETEKNVTFFLKRVPQTERHSNFVIGEGLFAKEKEIYDKIVPLFNKHLNDTMPVPKCYYIKDNEYVIFENLSSHGYELHDKLMPLDFEHCKVALKSIAKFHAASIVTECKTGTSMLSFVDNDNEVLLVDKQSNTIARTWHTASVETILGMLKEYGDYKLRVASNWVAVRNKMYKAWDKSIEMVAESSTKYRNVLCHRDLWLNNVMFKYKENGIPEEAALIDFQIYRYCPPAVDLTFFIYVTTSRETRDKHLRGLLLIYYQEVCSYLQAAGINPDVFTLQELLDSFDAYRLFGIAIAARYLPVCLRSNEDIEAVKKRVSIFGMKTNEIPDEYLKQRAEILLEGMKKSPAMASRITSAVNELLDFMNL